jgi:tetratricopeptide (TPR) repeat protein
MDPIEPSEAPALRGAESSRPESADSSEGPRPLSPLSTAHRSAQAPPRTLPPPEWIGGKEGPRSVASIALERYGLVEPIARQSGPRAELASLGARVRVAARTHDSVAERAAATSLARALAARGTELDEATRLARRALLLGEDPVLREDVANWFSLLGEPALAASTLEPLATSRSGVEAGTCWYRVGALLCRAGEARGARAALEQALALAPDDPLPAELLGAMGAWAEEVLPRENAAAHYLDASGRRERQGDRAGALEALFRAFEIAPESPQAAERLAASLIDAGRIGAADEVRREHAKNAGPAARAVHIRRLRNALRDGDWVRALGAAFDARLDGELDLKSVLSVISSGDSEELPNEPSGLDGVFFRLGLFDLLAARLELACDQLAGKESARVRRALARLYARELGRADRALEAWIEAFVTDPENDDAHEALVRYAAAARDPLPLVEALVRVIGDRPNFAGRARHLRELSTLASGRLDDPRLLTYALSRLQAIQAVDPAELAQARQAGERREAEIALLRAELGECRGPDRVPLLERLADLLGSSPDAADARLSVVLELIELSPSEWRHQKAVERLLVRQERHEELVVFYQRLAAAAPSALERARFTLAQSAVLRRRGDLDGALAELRPLLDESVAYPPALSLLVFLSAERGDDLLRARALARIAVGTGAVSRAALLAIAAESLLSLGEVDTARELSDLAVAADPSSARALSARAAVGAKTRDAWGARAMERALSVIAPRAELCAALADTYDRLEEPLLALAFSQRWVALRPGDARASCDRLERARRAADGALLADAVASLLAQPLPVAELALPVGRALMALAPLQPMRASALARRALDVIGPRALDLRLAVLAVAEVTGESGLAITALERWLGSGASGSSRGEILLDLARRRRVAGDADGAARALMRAIGEGAWGTAVLAELDTALPARSSDGQIALYAARAEALGALSESDQRGTAHAFRELGAAYWDLASDPLSAFTAWERALTLDPAHGVECYASDLLAFGGADAALHRLQDLAGRRADRGEAARVLVVAATLALELGRPREAFALSSRGLELDPSRTDVLGVVERAAGEEDVDALERLYQLLAEATVGRFGERAAHYRAARQMERRKALPQALSHAVRAFELVPSEGVLFVTMVRLGERIGNMVDVVAAIERVADRSSNPEVRATWLRKAALLSDSSEQGLLQRIEILLRALSVRPDSATLSGLSRALNELLPRAPSEREALELRVVRATEALLSRAEGPEGARLSIQCAELLIQSFGGALETAVAAIGRAIECDAGAREFVQLVPLVPRLESLGHALLARIQSHLDAAQAEAGAPLLELGSALAAARGDRQLGTRLLVHAARKEPENTELVVRAEREARALADPELIELVLDAIPPSERADALVELALRAESPREALDYFDRALEIEDLPAALEHELGERRLELLRRARLTQRLVPELERRLPTLEPGDARAALAAEIAHLLAERGDYQRAIRVIEREIPSAPRSRELFETLAAIARASNQFEPLAGALSALVELARGTDEELGLLRELAELFQQVGDRNSALLRWEEILVLDPADLNAIAGVEREAERGGDYERLVELLARRASLAKNPEDVRAIRLRRATVLEQRLGRAEDARAELEGLLATTGDSLSALRMLADLQQRLGAPLSAAPLWLRASRVARDPDETADLVRRSCEAYLQGGDAEAARQALDALDGWAHSEATLTLAVEVGRRRDDPLSLALALEQLAELSSVPVSRRVALWLEAARASITGGADEAALRRAQSAARLDPASADAQLLVLSLEYRRQGRVLPNEAEAMVALLRRLGERLPPEQLELRAFLLAEALELSAGPDAALVELERTQSAIGARPLLALAFAERLADRGESARALDAYDVALAGELSSLKNPAEVAFRAAKLARALGDLERAARYLELLAKDPVVRERAQKLSVDVLAERARAPGAPRAQNLDPARGRYSQRPADAFGEEQIATELSSGPALLISEAPPRPSGEPEHFVTSLPPGRYSLHPSIERLASVPERRFSTEPPPLTRDADEQALYEAMLAGDFNAGRELLERFERTPDRARDVLLVSRRFAQLHPADRFALEKLHQATSREGNAVHAQAIAHALAVLDPSAEASPDALRAPALSEIEEQPDVIRSLILRDLSSRALEAFALVWDGAEHVFRRDASTYGVTGLERIPPGSPTPLARSCGAASRALGLSRTPLFQRRSAGSITVGLALLSPPAIVVSGEVRQETPELGFHLGAMLLGTLPQFVLLFGSSEAQARAVLAGLRFAFGPPQVGSNSAGIPSLAEILWESIPARLQRQLRELCDDPSALEYEGAMRLACAATRRAGLFVCGDLGVALREACLDEQLPLERLASADGVAQLARSNASIRSLLQMAVSLEYAETRWRVARPLRQGGL